MNKQELRQMVIDLLDDGDGVNAKGFAGLQRLCEENGWVDIMDCVKGCEGRAYLGEDDAEDLRAV